MSPTKRKITSDSVNQSCRRKGWGAVTLDPGNTSGVAFWGPDARLESAFKIQTRNLVKFADTLKEEWGMNTPPALLLWEKPVVYERKKSKGNPNDLIGLPLVAGVAIGALLPGRIDSKTPAEWKGQLPKTVCHKRAKKVLLLEELQCITHPEDHNCWDAIALGLFHFRRLER